MRFHLRNGIAELPGEARASFVRSPARPRLPAVRSGLADLTIN
jgi:hypothetical protein